MIHTFFVWNSATKVKIPARSIIGLFMIYTRKGKISHSMVKFFFVPAML